MKQLCLTSALCLLAMPALADITPDDVLANWQGIVERARVGFYTGTQQYEGDVLVLTDVRFAPISQAEPKTGGIDWIRFTPQPDGAISITFSSLENDFETTGVPRSPDAVVRTHTGFEGLSFIASGAPSRIVYELAAERFRFSHSTEGALVDTKTAVTISNISGHWGQSEISDGIFSSEGQVDAGSMQIDWSWQAGTSGATIQVGSATVNQLSLPMSLVAPRAYFATASDLDQLIPEGVLLDMKLQAKDAVLHMDGGAQDPDFTLDLAAGESLFGIEILESQLRYVVDASVFNVASNSPAFPGQLMTLDMDRMLFDILMPFRKGATPVPFDLAFQLENLELAPAVWDTFDPSAEMLRLPASLDLRLTGEAAMLVNFLDEAEMNAIAGSPMQLHTLTLERFDIQAENARVTGAGGIVVDTESISSTTGRPEFTGAVDIALTGALAFLDRFGRLPSLDPMMAIGAKGALGMFANPAGGPDSLTTRIEFTDGGHISINGQQVK